MRKIVDSIGRVLIPKDLREKYNLKPGTDYFIIEEKDGLRIEAQEKLFTISNEDMKVLRKLYLMLSDNDLLDDYYETILSKITRKSEIKCDKCNSNLFITNDNSYKCFKCGD